MPHIVDNCDSSAIYSTDSTQGNENRELPKVALIS